MYAFGGVVLLKPASYSSSGDSKASVFVVLDLFFSLSFFVPTIFSRDCWHCCISNTRKKALFFSILIGGVMGRCPCFGSRKKGKEKNLKDQEEEEEEKNHISVGTLSRRSSG